jgi:hypothetical protein
MLAAEACPAARVLSTKAEVEKRILGFCIWYVFQRSGVRDTMRRSQVAKEARLRGESEHDISALSNECKRTKSGI